MNFPDALQLRHPAQDLHTRASLIARVRNLADDTSWREFFTIYCKLIKGLALRAGLTNEEAEDVVQSTMIAVAGAMSDFEYNRKTGSFKNWICGQAKWKISDHLRRHQRAQRVFSPAHGTPSADTGTVVGVPDDRNEYAAFLERDWNEVVVETACNQVKAMVKPKHFQIFDLYAMKCWPLRRISRTLSVSVPQVYLIKSRVSRLLKKQTREVKAQLERFPSPGIQKQNRKTKTV